MKWRILDRKLSLLGKFLASWIYTGMEINVINQLSTVKLNFLSGVHFFFSFWLTLEEKFALFFWFSFPVTFLIAEENTSYRMHFLHLITSYLLILDALKSRLHKNPITPSFVENAETINMGDWKQMYCIWTNMSKKELNIYF